MYNKLITKIKLLGFTSEIKDKLLFYLYHLDNYPKGNYEIGNYASLENIKPVQDITTKNC